VRHLLVPALRRFAILLIAIGVGTLVASILVGLLLGASLPRSIALGYYLVGCFLLLAGFFFGNRGPVRPKGDVDTGGMFMRAATRRLRWATRDEQEESINSSAVFVLLGVALIVLGAASDNRHALF
jgi:hypothetical protein